MGNNAKRITRQLQAHFGISYSEALRCYRDTRALDDYQAQFQVHRDAGKGHVDAGVAVCVDTWAYDDDR